MKVKTLLRVVTNTEYCILNAGGCTLYEGFIPRQGYKYAYGNYTPDEHEREVVEVFTATDSDILYIRVKEGR